MAQAAALRTSSWEASGTRIVSDNRWGELMTAAQAGNGSAYNRLLTEVTAWLQGYYARRLPHSFVDDAVQEALVAVHTKRHTYEPGRPFRAWLAGIARYKWIDRLRSIGRDRSEPIEGNDIPIADHGLAVTSKLDVDSLIGKLKPAQAEAIRLVKLEGYSLEEAATTTGQSVSLVKINIHRGVARLTSIIEATRTPPNDTSAKVL